MCELIRCTSPRMGTINQRYYMSVEILNVPERFIQSEINSRVHTSLATFEEIFRKLRKTAGNPSDYKKYKIAEAICTYASVMDVEIEVFYYSNNNLIIQFESNIEGYLKEITRLTKGSTCDG